jgi:hydroxymethylglutaryl-CoA lyase
MMVQELQADNGQQFLSIAPAARQKGIIIPGYVSCVLGYFYTKVALGNLDSEDFLYMLEGLDINSGVDLSELFAAGDFICAELTCES